MAEFSETEGLVLFFTDVGEEDRIVTFLTREHGLLRAAAAGALSLSKGRTSAFDLFARVTLSVHHSSKPGKLPRVRGAVVIDPHLPLREDYTRLCAASYIGETVARSAQEGDPAPGLLELVLLCFERLGKGKPPAGILLLFEARYLKEMGWLPELNLCVHCKKPVKVMAALSAGLGGVVHPACPGGRDGASLKGGQLAILRFLTGRSLRGAGNLGLSPSSAAVLFLLLHPFTRHHLGFEPRSFRALGALGTLVT